MDKKSSEDLLEKLRVLRLRANIPKKPDQKTSKESEYWDSLKHQAEIDDLNQNIKLRKHFAWSLFGLTVFWIIVIDSVIFLEGFKFYGFTISDKVFIALITSTTINVLGLFMIVVRNLFPNKDSVYKH